MEKNNPRTGSSFDAFLKEQGMYDDVTAKALKRAIAEQLLEGIPLCQASCRVTYLSKNDRGRSNEPI